MTVASVIIPTRGRDTCLRRTLDSLDNQNTKDFDVWVVDQNDVPLQNLNQHMKSVRLYHEKMPPKGSHAGRNHAIFKTKNSICIFVDDDVTIPPGFVKAHLEAQKNHPNTVVVGKVIQPKDNFTEAQMAYLGKLARYNSFTGIISGNFIGNQPGKIHHIHECNFSVPTEGLKKVGGFNEEFKGNAYFEGADLGLKLIKNSYSMHYEPLIWLIHHQEGAGGNRVNDKITHTYWFMRNYGLLNSLHMHRIGLPIFASYSFMYVIGKAAKNQSIALAKNGLKGLFDGLRYFIKQS